MFRSWSHYRWVWILSETFIRFRTLIIDTRHKTGRVLHTFAIIKTQSATSCTIQTSSRKNILCTIQCCVSRHSLGLENTGGSAKDSPPLLYPQNGEEKEQIHFILFGRIHGWACSAPKVKLHYQLSPTILLLHGIPYLPFNSVNFCTIFGWATSRVLAFPWVLQVQRQLKANSALSTCK